MTNDSPNKRFHAKMFNAPVIVITREYGRKAVISINDGRSGVNLCLTKISNTWTVDSGSLRYVWTFIYDTSNYAGEDHGTHRSYAVEPIEKNLYLEIDRVMTTILRGLVDEVILG